MALVHMDGLFDIFTPVGKIFGGKAGEITQRIPVVARMPNVQVRTIFNAFQRSQQPPAEAISSGLYLGNGGTGGEPGTSPLPILLGAAALAGLLLLAFGRRKKK